MTDYNGVVIYSGDDIFFCIPGSGTIKVTEYVANQTLKGTFNFKAENNTLLTANITDGSFSIKPGSYVP